MSRAPSPARQVGGEQPDDAFTRIGSLHRDHRQFGTFGDAHIECGGLLADPRQILVSGRRVDDKAEKIFGQKIDDEIVDHAALRVEHAGVERLAALLQLVHRVGDQMTQKLPGARAAQVDHGHVRHIEHAGVAANLMMLVDLRAVADRHVPPAEVDHLGAERAVGVVEDGLLRHGAGPVGEAGIIPERNGACAAR